MATIKVLEMCAEGCHAIVEITTTKGTDVRQVDFGAMLAEKTLDETVDHILRNMRTAMKLGGTNPKALAAMLNNRTFQE